VDVDAAFQKTNNFQASTQLYKIHNQSFTDFHKWTLDWSDQTGVPLHIDEAQLQTTLPKQHVFRVTEKSNLNEDDTFTLILKSPRKVTFQSGDLLAFYPEAHGIPRYYSIGRSGKNLLLSIKKHEFGKASSLLSQLQLGDSIKASIKKNPHFHFPKRAKDVILIANGTGIAPFLGMIQEIEKGQNVHLFWGGRTATSFNLYKDFIDCALLDGKLKDLHLAYSREEHQKTYVQDVLEAQSELVFHTLKNNGVIMICGSLVMEKGVKNVLEKITYNRLKKSLAAFHEQIQSDCY
jgi:sulfite reductase (NADPH) flavoprotein alpha-component